MLRPVSGIAFALLLVLPIMPLSASVSPVPLTLYLHGTTPTTVVDEQVGDPTMDETPPSGAVSKVGYSSAGNQAFRKNFLLSYWAAPTHGHVTNGVANLWLQANAGGQVTVTIFGDGAVGSGAPVAQKSLSVPAGAAKLYSFAFPTLDAMVDNEIVLSVYGGTQGTSVLYDSVAHPSSFSFDLGEYVAPPPPGGGTPIVPAAGWKKPVLADATLSGREASLAINPMDNSQLFMCTPTGVPQTDYGSSFFTGSNNGGQTWAPVMVEDDDLRSQTYEGGDCDVAFDEGGTMYSADTWLGSLSVGHSTDGGQTWDGTPIAATGPIVDRPWLVGGPAGTVHITYQDVQFGMPTVIWYTRSTDYGVTFSPAVPIVTSAADGGFSWEGNLLVAPNGQDMYLAYTTRMDSQYLLGNAERVKVAVSHDAGASWTQIQVAALPEKASYLYPSIGLDNGGGLHVVWAQKTAVDQPIWHAYSGDQGATWSAPKKVITGVGGGAPWVVGGTTLGSAAITWLGVKDAFTGGANAANQEWFFFAARVSGADTGAPTFVGGATTISPIYKGTQAIPEFIQVRLDDAGKMHIGGSANVKDAQGVVRWGMWHQTEA